MVLLRNRMPATRAMRRCAVFLFVVMSIVPPVLRAEARDSVHQRHFDSQRLEKFRSDPEFAYDTPRFSGNNALNTLIADLRARVFRYLFEHTTEGFWQATLLLLALAALAYSLRFFFGSSVSPLFSASGRAFDAGNLSELEIRETDLDAILRESLKTGAYRDAVRILYLMSLRHLSDDNRIVLGDGKTNNDYCRELDRPLQQPFVEVTRVFEYVFYGQFEVDADAFHAIHGEFEKFERLIGESS